MAEEQNSRTIAALQSRPSWGQTILVTSIAALLLSVGLTFFGFKSEAIKTSAQETKLSEATDKIEHSNITQTDDSLVGKVEIREHLVSKLDEKQPYDQKRDHAKSKISDENYIISKDKTPKHQPFSENNLVIPFDLNSSKLPNKAIETLDQLAEFIINSPELSFI